MGMIAMELMGTDGQLRGRVWREGVRRHVRTPFPSLVASTGETISFTGPNAS